MKSLDTLSDPTLVQWVLGSSWYMTMPGLMWPEYAGSSCRIKSNQNQITFIVTSPQHKCLGELNSYERAPDSAKKKTTTTIYIWTVHIYRLYRRQCAKYTYIYSVHIVYYKDILSYQYTLYTVYVHIYIMYTSIHSNNVKVQQIINLQQIGCATDSCAKVQQIMHMQCRGCAFVCCPVIADVLVQCVRVVR